MTTTRDSPESGDGVRLVVRVWLPDRPGALGLVASRIGAIGGDIVGIDVLERSEHVAVDEFAVDAPRPRISWRCSYARSRRSTARRSRSGARSPRFPDPRLDALEIGRAPLRCATTRAELAQRLVDSVRDEFAADWAVVLRGDDRRSRRRATTFPTRRCSRRSRRAPRASPIVAAGDSGPGRPRGRAASRRETWCCSSGATAIRSAGASVASSSRSRGSPTGSGRSCPASAVRVGAAVCAAPSCSRAISSSSSSSRGSARSAPRRARRVRSRRAPRSRVPGRASSSWNRQLGASASMSENDAAQARRRRPTARPSADPACRRATHRPGAATSSRAVVVWRPRWSFSRTSPIACTAAPTSPFTSLDLPTPDAPMSATVRSACASDATRRVRRP